MSQAKRVEYAQKHRYLRDNDPSLFKQDYTIIAKELLSVISCGVDVTNVLVGDLTPSTEALSVVSHTILHNLVMSDKLIPYFKDIIMNGKLTYFNLNFTYFMVFNFCTPESALYSELCKIDSRLCVIYGDNVICEMGDMTCISVKESFNIFMLNYNVNAEYLTTCKTSAEMLSKIQMDILNDLLRHEESFMDKLLNEFMCGARNLIASTTLLLRS